MSCGSDKVALREANGQCRTLTDGHLATDSTRFAGALTHQGVRREERGAVIVPGQIEFPVVF